MSAADVVLSRPCLPPQPVRLSGRYVRAMAEAGGAYGVRLAVRDGLREIVRGRARSPLDALALAAWAEDEEEAQLAFWLPPLGLADSGPHENATALLAGFDVPKGDDYERRRDGPLTWEEELTMRAES